MGKPSSQTTTQQTVVDPTTQQRGTDVWNAANAASATPAAGINPWTTQAAGLFGGIAGAGANGVAALNGDPSAVASYMNPYQSQVLDQIQAQYGKLNHQVMNAVDDRATQAGAFGGDRHGIATGTALGDLNASAQQQIAGVTSQGYTDAMNRAGTAAGLGLSAGGQLAGLGQYATQYADENSPAMRRYGLLSGAMGSIPSGSTTSTTTPINRNPWATAGGLAATGLGLASGLGWAPLAGKALTSWGQLGGLARSF